MRMSINEYKLLFKAEKRNKYNAKPKIVDGIRFDSTAEADFYEQLKLRKLAGDIDYFLRQVPIDLPGNVKMKVDFMIAYPDKREEFIDVKGVITRDWRAKQKIAEAIYPFKIKTVRSVHAKKSRRGN